MEKAGKRKKLEKEKAGKEKSWKMVENGNGRKWKIKSVDNVPEKCYYTHDGKNPPGGNAGKKNGG